MNTFLEVLVAVGTISVAILAIWGDWFKAIFAGPKLTVRLRSQRGNPTTFQSGQNVIYYHLIVENRRNWALAKGVQVVITEVSNRIADGSFRPEVLPASVPLTWAYPQFSPINPSIRDQKVCDLGYLVENSDYFTPSLYFYPNNFPGFVRAGGAVRYSIELQGENFQTTVPLVVEVYWDGAWDRDLDAMERHLVVREVR